MWVKKNYEDKETKPQTDACGKPINIYSETLRQ